MKLVEMTFKTVNQLVETLTLFSCCTLVFSLVLLNSVVGELVGVCLLYSQHIVKKQRVVISSL